MKGGLHGLRTKQISLTLIVFICGTIFIWTWDRTSLLSTFLPPQDQLLKPYPDINLRRPLPDLTPVIHVNIDLEDAVQEEEKNTPNKADMAETIPLNEEKGLHSGSLDEPEHDINGEIRLPVENTPDSGTPIETNVYKTGKDENQDADEKKETLSGSSEERNISKQDHNEETLTESVQKSPESGTLMGSETLESYQTKKYENLAIDHMEKKDCNYGKGKWVEDSSRPLYSGFECKQWLSEMWACRLTQRTDFSYERFRWHPTDCEMPEFEGSSFLKRMQDKTIAIVGDSLGRQQFQSLMCMVTGGKLRSDFLDVGGEYGLIKAHGATRPDGWAFRFTSTNTTILYYWSASLTDLTPIDITNPATNWAMHLDRPPAFLRNYLHKFDVLVLNTGHHWNRGKVNANRWVMYVGGVPNRNRKIAEIGGAKNFTIYSVVRWLDSQLPKHPKLKAFFRTLSPRHFFHGDWNTGGSCDNTTPLAGGKEVVQDESSDPIVSGAVEGTRVKLLDITALSQLRDEGHISRYSIKATPGVQDCLHWCLPGVPDTWNEILAAQV